MPGGVEVNNGAKGQKRHALVQAVQWVSGHVEKENIAQAQHQARHRHGKHGQQLQWPAKGIHAFGFFHQIGRAKNQQGAKHSRAAGHLQTVDEAFAHLTIDQAQCVMAQTGAQVVRPKTGEGGNHRHAQHGQHDG